VNPKLQARIWQLVFALVGVGGVGLFAVPGGAPFGIAACVLGAIGWVAITAILNYHKN
jgi:drug/metabolite transporter (DMT)-like permease